MQSCPSHFDGINGIEYSKVSKSLFTYGNDGVVFEWSNAQIAALYQKDSEKVVEKIDQGDTWSDSD